MDEDGIEVRYEHETIWLSQKLIAELFEEATTEDFSVVQTA